MKATQTLFFSTACFGFGVLLLATVASSEPKPQAVSPAGTGAMPVGSSTATSPVTTTAPTSTTPVGQPPDERRTHTQAAITLKVLNQTEARQKVEAAAKAMGGFPTLVSDTELRLKVPPRQLSTLLDQISAEGLVIEKSLTREDLTLELAKLEGQLESKHAILAELRSFFDGSDVAATLQIERSMTDLVNELEAVKGALRVLRDRSTWASVHVSFQFRERQRIESVTSEFDWLNTVNLERFLGEF